MNTLILRCVDDRSVLHKRNDRTTAAATTAAVGDNDSWRRRWSAKAEQEKDAQATNDLFESSTTAAISAISTNSVLGAAGESRTGRHARTYANAGQLWPLLTVPTVFRLKLSFYRATLR